jgi:RHS repeat-associated protein
LFYYNNPDRPFQLTEVISENRPAQFRTNQTVAYTSFQRPSMINQGDYTTFFTYNSAGDRVRMQTTHIKGGELQDRFYIGSRYEADILEHETILWLGGDAYSAPAALKREFGGEWKIYYICRDYLGSIYTVTDASGAIVQEVSYDAWGRLRNAQTHQLYTTEPRLFLGNRGFTGHEHLTWYGLINMNARLYDPLVGRFLSPDPFVQAPDFTQSFNRYSYVWNNPLRWIDPTGMIVTGSGSTNNKWWEMTMIGGMMIIIGMTAAHHPFLKVRHHRRPWQKRRFLMQQTPQCLHTAHPMAIHSNTPVILA